MVGSAAVGLLAISGNEIALGAVALAFIVFALIVSMVVPRYRPDFPGKGGVGVLVLASLVFFLGTMTAVFVFGEAHEAEAAHETGTTPHETGEEADTETGEEEAEPEIAEGPATTAPGESADTIRVEAVEFKFSIDETDLAPSRYTFELRNEGEVPHDLVIEGPEIDDARTPVIPGGERAQIEAALVEGTYKLYCSVPGHEDLGMVAELNVG